MKEYYCLQCSLMQHEYDALVGDLYALGMEGCEERCAGGDRLDITVYFSGVASARSAADHLQKVAPDCGPVAIRPVPNEDWNARWRESMKPALLCPSWWVAPLWLPPPLCAGDHWIKIEPKMAFGTGHHETTRLAAGALISINNGCANESLLDIGTGSGVLCFVAAMSGVRHCVGIEIDRECRENLVENRALNDTSAQCSFMVGSIDALKGARFNVIVMNMIHTESAPLLEQCRAMVAKGGALVWSGILLDEKQRAIDAARIAGFVPEREFDENEWWCAIFR